nr:E-beta-farnesene synthase [Tanacetum cinerariifolium]
FHPRPDSLLHLPNEEPVLGYLKFSAKGTKREVFGMPIPGSLITAEIQEASYYQEYLLKVAQHRSTSQTTGKKCKEATETSDKPPKAKKSKYGMVSKKRTLKYVAVSEAEDVPIMEPQGPLPPVEIKEPKSGKYQLLPEVSGKGKAKVIKEQSDSEEESEKVVIGAPEEGKDEDQAGPDPGAQAEGQTGSDSGAQDEGQAGSNPNETSEGQAGPDPGNAGAEVQSIPSPVVHAGLDRKHMDLDVADVSPQPFKEQLDEGFTAMAYPKVQENLKLAVKEQVLLEDLASSSGTISSLQHLSRDISFGDQFFSDKPSDADKNAEIKVESMVNVPIQQALSSISLM